MANTALPSGAVLFSPRRWHGCGTSIRSALTGLLAVTIVIVGGQAWFSLRQLSEMYEGLTKITVHWLPAVDSADRINTQINDIRSKQYRIFVTKGHELSKAQQNLDRGLRALAEARGVYEALIASDEERQAYDRFSTEWARYSDLWAKTTTLLSADHQDEALEVFKSDMWTVSNDASAALDELVGIVRRKTIEAVEATGSDKQQADIVTFIALCLALAIAGLATTYILTWIVRPLSLITVALTRLAAGDRGFAIPALQRRDELGHMAKAFEVFRARTLELEEAHRLIQIAQEEAQALARHDALTGLPNRRLFASELDDAIRRAEAGMGHCSVLLIDLDAFKPVNDRFGHASGDAVLCEVANRLKRLVRGADLAARLGGDEFAVITAHPGDTVAGRSALVRLARQVIQAVQEPITIGASCVRINASVGLASYPADGEGTDALMHAVDLAMYRAKQGRSGRFMFFERGLDQEMRTRATLEGELRLAIARGDIQPFYQPLVELVNKRIVGFEILARWNHPERGSMPLDLLIPIAEELGIIADLTASILRQACAHARQWPKDVFVALNVSAVELQDTALPTRILEILSLTGFPPSRLEVEITETALMHDREIAKTVMTALQALGIGLALDDFGTGYSSLNHLVHFSFDKIKIDRSFIQDICRSSASAKIVDAVLALARYLGIAAVAEGIESEAVLDYLITGGCRYGQGYHFGKPVGAAEVLSLLDLDVTKE